MPNLPVYRLKPVGGSGPGKVIHRNHILPLGQEVQLSAGNDSQPVCSPRVRRKRKAKENSINLAHNSDPKSHEPQKDSGSSDSESDFGYYFRGLDLMETDATDFEESEPAREEPHDSTFEIAAPEVIEAPMGNSVMGPNCVGDAHEDAEGTFDKTIGEQDCDAAGLSMLEAPVEIDDTPCVGRTSQRVRKPAERFTYSTLGEPTTETVLTTKSCNVCFIVETVPFPAGFNESHVWWCNPQALRRTCSKVA